MSVRILFRLVFDRHRHPTNDSKLASRARRLTALGSSAPRRVGRRTEGPSALCGGRGLNVILAEDNEGDTWAHVYLPDIAARPQHTAIARILRFRTLRRYAQAALIVLKKPMWQTLLPPRSCT